MKMAYRMSLVGVSFQGITDQIVLYLLKTFSSILKVMFHVNTSGAQIEMMKHKMTEHVG